MIFVIFAIQIAKTVQKLKQIVPHVILELIGSTIHAIILAQFKCILMIQLLHVIFVKINVILALAQILHVPAVTQVDLINHFY
jgi:hypothetical protein